MDIEKLIEAVRLCGSTPKVDQCKQCAYWSGGDMSKCIPRMTTAAATALSTLQDENEKLRAESIMHHNAADNYFAELTEYRQERNEALAELEEVKRERDALIEDFVDYVTGGVPNPAIFCKNRCDKCTDMRGWCTGKDCKGFYPSGASGQMDKNCGTCNWYNDGTCLNDQSSVYKTGEHNTCPHWETYDEGMWGEG